MLFKDRPKDATHRSKGKHSRHPYYFKVTECLVGLDTKPLIQWWSRDRWISSSWGVSMLDELPPLKISIEEKLLNAF